MKVLRSSSARLLALLSSISLAGVLICLLALLTFLGTLEQAEHGLYEVQRRYFESSFLMHDLGGVPIPLPGGGLVMGLLFVNLTLGGVLRLRRRASTAGVLTAHVGMLIMLAAGFVKYATGEEGHVTLYEGESADWFQSYTESELAIVTLDEAGEHTEHVVAGELASGASAANQVTVEGLPFELQITHWFDNANVLPKGPMFDVDVPVVDGLFLREEERSPEAERNGPGAYVTLSGADGSRQVGMLWAFDAAPWTVEVDGARYALDLRRTRYPMPFEVRLDKFTKEDHPGTNMPAWFSSDVAVTAAGAERPVTISMNQPLREEGLVLYQASWGPASARPGQPLFSTLAVVRNPADQWPLYSCLVIAAGLLFHFGRKLGRHVRSEVAR